MQTVYELSALRDCISDWKKSGLTISAVPTMGNLHDGHLSLLEKARELADRTVVSIFVNPIQFGKGEDYERYPSTLKEDQDKLEENGLDLLFAPDLQQLYPGGMDSDTRVTVPEISHILCGEFRPGHFSGVATVVTKLLINMLPDYALFGEKDYQQLLVIRRLVADLCMPVEVIGIPIMRETDGLAMSSRNDYLNTEERRRAPLIYQTLLHAVAEIRQGNRDFSTVEAAAMEELSAGGFRPEYFAIRRADDLAEPGPEDRRLVILAAAWLGAARLIDNISINLD